MHHGGTHLQIVKNDTNIACEPQAAVRKMLFFLSPTSSHCLNALIFFPKVHAQVFLILPMCEMTPASTETALKPPPDCLTQEKQ